MKRKYLWKVVSLIILSIFFIYCSGSIQANHPLSREEFFTGLPIVLSKTLPYSSDFKIIYDSGILLCPEDIEKANREISALTQSLEGASSIPISVKEAEELLMAFQKINLDYLKPAGVETHISARDPLKLIELSLGNGVSTTSSGERIVLAQVVVTNIFGWALVTFYHQLHWYWNQSVITSVYPLTWGVVHAPGWEYVGLTGMSGYYSADRTSYHSFGQGYFRLGVQGIYISHVYPWIMADIYRGGNYFWYGSW